MRQSNVRVLACLLVFLCSFLLSMQFGGSDLSWGDIAEILAAKLSLSPAAPGNLEVKETILFSIRLPRTLVAALCGAALAAAGVLSQGLFRNSLASPEILGTTAGGSAAAALAFYFGAAGLQWFMLPVAAFVGACAATSFILFVASLKRLYSLESLLLAGFAINAFLGACTSLVVSLVLEDYQKFPALVFWLMGGLNARGWEHFAVGALPVAVAIALAYRLCGKLNVLTLGEEVATTLSIDIPRLKRQTIIVISLLVGTAVSIAGAITFVGLIVPHLTRLLIGPESRRLLLVSSINGATLVILADLAARTLRAPMELQVGVLIAMIGAPFFFWLLWRNAASPWEEAP